MRKALPPFERTYDQQDLRAYPNQTAVSFWIIVLVVLGAMTAGAIGPSPILMWPITLTMFILPVRALLSWPDRELKKLQDKEATAELTKDGTLPQLQTTLNFLAVTNGYHQPIKIIISGPKDKLHTVGSWQRHYLFIGQKTAHRLVSDLQNPEYRIVAESALLHEIAHFLNRDVQRVGYTRELLGSSFWVILWWMVFLLGWMIFANLAGRAYLDFDINRIPDLDPITQEILGPFVTLSPENRAEIADKIENVNIGLLLNYIFITFIPIIWMGFFLWLFFWRRMLRLQEHYADHFVVNTTSNPTALQIAWQVYEQPLVVLSSQLKALDYIKMVWKDFWFNLTEVLKEKDIIKSNNNRFFVFFNRLKLWFSNYPLYEQREFFLLNPLRIYGSWLSSSLQILALVLALEILATTPLIGYHLGSTYVVHFTTVAVFIMLASWILPLVVQQQSVKSVMIKSLTLIYGVRLGWITFTFLVLYFLANALPDYTLDLLNAVVFSGGRFAGNLTFLPVNDPVAITLSILPSYYALQILSIVAVVMLLWVYIRLQRRAVAASTAVNWHKRHRNLILALSVVALTLLTPLSDLIQGYFDGLFTPMRLISYALGICSILWLVIWGRRVS